MGGRLGDQNLPVVPDRQQPGATIERGAEVVVVLALRMAGMQGHAYAQGRQRRVGVHGEKCGLRLNRCGDRFRRHGKDGAECISDRLEDAPSVRGDRFAHTQIVPGQRGTHGCRVQLPQPCAALNVGKKKRKGSLGQVHGGSLATKRTFPTVRQSYVSFLQKISFCPLTLTLRHPVHWQWKGAITLKQHLYPTGAFAKRAYVSIRTLRYYDRVGLLSPSERTDSGYRLYSEQDLATLQHILALKFLGLTLEEIRRCLDSGPRQLAPILAQQRAMLVEKREQLDAILKAIDAAQTRLQSGQCDGETIRGVIQVIQMQQKQEWIQKYFTDDQLQKLDALTESAYSEEGRARLAQRGGWTEEDQKQASEKWAYVAAESERLAAAGADPGGEEGQALAKFKSDLLFAFTQGDPDIQAGLSKFWESHNALPEGEQPLTTVVPSAAIPGANNAGAQFLEQAMILFRSLGHKVCRSLGLQVHASLWPGVSRLPLP